MSALNIEFSDDELADLREIAREQGVPMKAFVREATADAIARHRALREGAEVFGEVLADSRHADTIEAAGIQERPRSNTPGEVA